MRDPMANLLIKFIDTLNKCVRLFLAVALLSMVALIFTQVVVRFALPFFGASLSLPWTEEAARYLLVWVIFLGGAIAARHGMLIAVTALIEALPAIPALRLRYLAGSILILTFLTMTWHGWRWADFGADEISPALMISKFWLYLAMPIGCALAALNTAVFLWQWRDAHAAIPHQ